MANKLLSNKSIQFQLRTIVHKVLLSDYYTRVGNTYESSKGEQEQAKQHLMLHYGYKYSIEVMQDEIQPIKPDLNSSRAITINVTSGKEETEVTYYFSVTSKTLYLNPDKLQACVYSAMITHYCNENYDRFGFVLDPEVN